MHQQEFMLNFLLRFGWRQVKAVKWRNVYRDPQGTGHYTPLAAYKIQAERCKNARLRKELAELEAACPDIIQGGC